MEIDQSNECQIASSDTAPAWAIELRSIVIDRLAALESTMNNMLERAEAQPEIQINGVDEASPDTASPVPPDTQPEPMYLAPSTSTDGDAEDWFKIMLDPSFFTNPDLSDSIVYLRENILQGNDLALSLLGQLVVFRCATADRKPSLLKDVGEAYYRCFPKTHDQSDPFENALAAWSSQQCKSVGLPNSIALVHPGERFDASRHSTVERGGVEIVGVYGWIVLREGGRVYSKASVQTR